MIILKKNDFHGQKNLRKVSCDGLKISRCSFIWFILWHSEIGLVCIARLCSVVVLTQHRAVFDTERDFAFGSSPQGFTVRKALALAIK